jgi:hypothetical protein
MCAGVKSCDPAYCREADVFGRPMCQKFVKCERGFCSFEPLKCPEGETCFQYGAGICAFPKFCCNMFCRSSIVECYGCWPVVSTPAIAQTYPLPFAVSNVSKSDTCSNVMSSYHLSKTQFLVYCNHPFLLSFVSLDT